LQMKLSKQNQMIRLCFKNRAYRISTKQNHIPFIALLLCIPEASFFHLVKEKPLAESLIQRALNIGKNLYTSNRLVPFSEYID